MYTMNFFKLFMLRVYVAIYTLQGKLVFTYMSITIICHVYT